MARSTAIYGETYSKLANPQLRLFSLSKKSVTICDRGRTQDMITRRDEDSSTSMYLKSRSTARWEKQSSIISPAYSEIRVRHIRRPKFRYLTIWNNYSCFYDRLLDFFRMNCSIGDVGKICRIADNFLPVAVNNLWTSG